MSLEGLNLRAFFSGWHTRITWVALGVIVSVLAGCSQPVYRLYVSPQGDDARSGLSPQQAIASLSHAHELVLQAQPNTAIDVVVGAGVYHHQAVRWTYTNGYPITIGARDDVAQKPIFDGGGKTHTWFTLHNHSAQLSHVMLRNLQIQYYHTGISLQGDRDNPLGFNGANELHGMRFINIGGLFTTFGYSNAAVRLVNSRDNVISDCEFTNILNESAGASAIHGVYIAHYSSGNQIRDNRFSHINGDPIKVRDRSNANIIADNRFEQTGKRAYYQGWYCNKATRNDCTKADRECPSQGNVFRDNTLLGGFEKEIPVSIIRDADDACGVLSQLRLQHSGNVLTDQE